MRDIRRVMMLVVAVVSFAFTGTVRAQKAAFPSPTKVQVPPNCSPKEVRRDVLTTLYELVGGCFTSRLGTGVFETDPATGTATQVSGAFDPSADLFFVASLNIFAATSTNPNAIVTYDVNGLKYTRFPCSDPFPGVPSAGCAAVFAFNNGGTLNIGVNNAAVVNANVVTMSQICIPNPVSVSLSCTSVNGSNTNLTLFGGTQLATPVGTFAAFGTSTDSNTAEIRIYDPLQLALKLSSNAPVPFTNPASIRGTFDARTGSAFFTGGGAAPLSLFEVQPTPLSQIQITSIATLPPDFLGLVDGAVNRETGVVAGTAFSLIPPQPEINISYLIANNKTLRVSQPNWKSSNVVGNDDVIVNFCTSYAFCGDGTGQESGTVLFPDPSNPNQFFDVNTLIPANSLGQGVSLVATEVTSDNGNLVARDNTGGHWLLLRQPQVVCPSDIQAVFSAGSGTQSVTLGQATVTDVNDSAPTGTNNAPAQGFPAGVTVVTWTATDKLGNVGSCPQVVALFPSAGTTPTTTALNSSPNPSSFGQSVTVTATITPQGGGAATGTVTFNDGAASLGTGTVSGNAATLSTSTLSIGSHSITAVYGGDNTFRGSTSAAVTQVVSKSNSATSVSSSQNPSLPAQTVMFTAAVVAVAPGTGTPTGMVTFMDGTVSLGSGTLNASGQAAFATSALGGGSHSITAVYGGDTTFAGSTSSALTQIVNKLSTTTTITSSANPSAGAQAVTFTAAVAAVTPATGTPTGMVTFMDGTASLGTGTLNAGGQATLTTSTLTGGSHSITGVYAGDATFAGSTSQPLTQTVSAPDFTPSVTPASATIKAGDSATFKISIASSGGFSGAVTFSITGLPMAASGIFTPTSVTPPGSTMLQVSTTKRGAVPPAMPWNRPPGPLPLLWLLAAALAILASRAPALRTPRLRPLASCLPLALLVLGLGLAVGCSGGSGSVPTGTPAGTSTITVTATSGGVTHAVPLTLTVQ